MARALAKEYRVTNNLVIVEDESNSSLVLTRASDRLTLSFEDAQAVGRFLIAQGYISREDF